MPRPFNTLENLLNQAYESQTGCWVWNGGVTNSGYGKATVNYKTVLMHRYMYEATYGPIEEGLQLDHLCRNKLCINPEHLEPVTAKVNMERHYVNQTHCLRDHPLSGSNLYVTPDGRRQCKDCRRNVWGR
jgi:hypothetical protein